MSGIQDSMAKKAATMGKETEPAHLHVESKALFSNAFPETSKEILAFFIPILPASWILARTALAGNSVRTGYRGRAAVPGGRRNGAPFGEKPRARASTAIRRGRPRIPAEGKNTGGRGKPCQ